MSLQSVAKRLVDNRERIIEDWLHRVRAEVTEPSDAALVDAVPAILDSLAQALETGTIPKTAPYFIRHADDRSSWSNYSLGQLLREYRLLRQATLAVLEDGEPLTGGERELVLNFIDEGMEQASVSFTEVEHLHDRLEAQYLKILEKLATESANLETFGDTLQRLLEIVTDGMGARASTLLLYQADTLEVRVGSAVGPSPELATMYRAALALSNVAAPSTEESPSVRMIAVDTLKPEGRESLDRLDVRYLLRVPLPIGAGFPGALVLGFAESRSFEALEIRLLEVLGKRLAVFLSRAQMFEQSKATIARVRETMEEDIRLREQAVAEITHDLRNPLSVAKTGVELLKKSAGTPATDSIAARILRSIDRSDQMIGDLLDVYRVRAGKPLQLVADEYRMGELVQEVVAEMRLVHGDRFRCDVEPDVLGYWSRDGMRRVIENLLGNAVKYGVPGTPITIEVTSEDHHMILSVHNEGPPMSVEDQERVLSPFDRGANARGRPGWGIGLTLIRGIVSAHGGTLHIESTAGGGTTFTVKNPMDSRPFLSEP